ncbi:M24 family metallopeptidase [Iodidimonas gelatinilytica]|nr:Xaa-Pro peptidase family protein [Iodidimonas gelatinilytica]
MVTGCRAIKSPAEIALMQIATDITIAAYRHTVPRLEAGMQPADFRAMMDGATRALGGRPVFSMALFGPASAFPHGSSAPQILKEGDTVLMDCGCAVEGYQSDISRTVVYGTPSARQREVWAIERAAQMAAFEAAQPGAHCGDVDKAARALLESHGFGPGYQVPGLPHRTGHGIGMDGHESPNFVKDEATRIAPGMCFSNEPGIYIYGEFGVRLEDCLWIAEDGPRWFSTPSASLDDPLGLG